ncbi:hypothetical protein PhCBS80983_g02945 [Powellomyces hirtus]|uniref:POTRA domain-containing protein n=1 Tax=Powellomyces hirtus TaxID=109895 RepID=A0A507E4D1_9FUNG|nr:hypothetical protein PhCBS80983_g02945 [Powellomyces hirtus]
MEQIPPSAASGTDAIFEIQRESRRLKDLVTNSQERALHVNSIRIEGVEHTRRSVVEALVKPILESQNLGDIVAESREACQRLGRLGVFRDVGVTLDTPTDSFGASGELVDVVLTVKEGPRFYARTGADFSNYDTTTNVTTKISNALGAGECLEANASYAVQPSVALNESAAAFTSETGSYFQVLCSKPLIPTPTFKRPNRADPDARIEFAAYSTNRNMLLHMSHEEQAKGLAARYKTADPYYGSHEFAYDVAWRHLHNVAQDGSWSVRQDAGHTLKSAISHIYSRDHRNDPMLPTAGSYVRTREELSGLGGDVKFVKGEAEGQWAFSLGNGFTLATSIRGGLVLPLLGQRTRVNDRFLFGGPNSIRGFRQSGIGPMDKKDAIGGDAYWGAGLSLFTPLPYLVDKPMKGHFFVNSGTLVPINTGDTVQQNAQRLIASPSVSAGLGLAVRFSILRLEMNYCLPLAAGMTDRIKPGFQFGIGISYM